MEEYHILDQGLSRKSHLKTQLLHVRFGSKADIQSFLSDVRFTPKSGHR
jgi:hypothetical protein